MAAEKRMHIFPSLSVTLYLMVVGSVGTVVGNGGVVVEIGAVDVVGLRVVVDVLVVVDVVVVVFLVEVVFEVGACVVELVVKLLVISPVGASSCPWAMSGTKKEIE